MSRVPWISLPVPQRPAGVVHGAPEVDDVAGAVHVGELIGVIGRATMGSSVSGSGMPQAAATRAVNGEPSRLTQPWRTPCSSAMVRRSSSMSWV